MEGDSSVSALEQSEVRVFSHMGKLKDVAFEKFLHNKLHFVSYLTSRESGGMT